MSQLASLGSLLSALNIATNLLVIESLEINEILLNQEFNMLYVKDLNTGDFKIIVNKHVTSMLNLML